MSDNFKGYTVVDPTPSYNKALMDSFKSFGVGIKNNVNSFLDKLGTQEGITEEALGASNLGGVAGTFMGKNAKTFDKVAEQLANELKEQGAKADEIWKATQNRFWKSGTRQEIDDSGMKIKDTFNPKTEGTTFLKDHNGTLYTDLENLIDHKDLFKAYPDLKKTRIKINPNIEDGSASFNPNNNTITLGFKDGFPDTDNLIHEIQHSIQKIEGWQGGGNTSQFKPIMIETPNGKLRMISPFGQYQRVPGEWEARIANTRKDLTEAKRKKYFPDVWDEIPSGELNVNDPKYFRGQTY